MEKPSFKDDFFPLKPPFVGHFFQPPLNSGEAASPGHSGTQQASLLRGAWDETRNEALDGWKKLWTTGELWFSISLLILLWQVWGYTWYVPHFQIVLEFFGDLFWLCSMIHFGGGIRLSCSGIHSSISRWNHPTSCRRCSPEINGRCPAYGGRKTIPLSPKWS